MRALLVSVAAVAALGWPGSACAADLAPIHKAPLPPPAWSWTGLYLGTHTGTAATLGTIADPLGPSLYGDDVRSPGFVGGAQVGYNWQLPNASWVLGVEADASLADLDGTNTCYAYSATFTSFNCRVRTNAFGSVTGRVGYAFGPFDRSLVYVKGGFGWVSGHVDMVVDYNLFDVTGRTSTRFTAPGWTVGAGAEYALTAHWGVRAEYDYLDLGRTTVAAPAQSLSTVPSVPVAGQDIAVPGTSVSQQIHAFKLGVNYKFGPDAAPFPVGTAGPLVALIDGPAAVMPVKAPVAAAMAPGWAPGWAFEGGGRFWYSDGRYQKDVAPRLTGNPNPAFAISRLTWDGLTGKTGEVFGRIESPWNVFLKGFVGSGKLSGGTINDEDWGLGINFTAVPTGYSNTLGAASGHVSYGTVDLGYDWFRGPGYKLGGFVGYNEYRFSAVDSSCTQIALPASGICSPPTYGFGLGQNDKWRSLRLGTSAELVLMPRVRLVGDVAWLPYVKYNGQDLHPNRPFVADEWGTGTGAQAELFVSYDVTDQLSLGVGGRYWAMWTTTAGSCELPPAGQCPAGNQDMQFKTDRFGALFQAAYRWDAPAALLAKN